MTVCLFVCAFLSSTPRWKGDASKGSEMELKLTCRSNMKIIMMQFKCKWKKGYESGGQLQSLYPLRKAVDMFELSKKTSSIKGMVI